MRTIGIDISKDQLDLAAFEASRGAVTDERRHPNTPAGISAVVTQLQQLAPELIVLEATGPYHAPLLAALVLADLPVAVVNPVQVKAYRQTQLGRTKTDRQDARLLARFAAAHANEVRRSTPPSAEQRQLSAWVSYRDSLVAEQTRLSGQAEANNWQGDAQGWQWLESRTAELERRLAEVDTAIAKLLAAFPEARVLQEMTGVGPKVAAAVLGYVPVGIWGRAKAAAADAGVHPHLEHSGRQHRSWLSKTGHARLRRYRSMAAMVAVKHDADLKTFYDRLIARGNPKQVAMCAAMHKLLRRMMGRLKAYYQGQEVRPTN
jgi:transposase